MLTHNHAHFFQQAVESVMRQTFWPSMELLIGEDGSTDGSDILADRVAVASPHSVHVFHSPNGPVGFHRNFERLYRASKGKYLAFLESDDWWTDSSKIAKQVEMLDSNPELVFCGGRTLVVDERSCGNAMTPASREIGPSRYANTLSFEDLIFSFSFHGSSVMMRRSVVEMPDWIFQQYCLDRALYLLAARHGDAGVIDSVLSCYRLHATGVWAPLTPLEKAKRSRALFQVFCSHFPGRYRPAFNKALHGILSSYVAESLQGNTPKETAQLLAVIVKAVPRQALLHHPRFLFGVIRLLLRGQVSPDSTASPEEADLGNADYSEP